MASQSESEIGINSWLEDELCQQYLHDRSTVDEGWKHVFEEPRPPANGGAAAPEPAPGEQLLPLARRLADFQGTTSIRARTASKPFWTGRSKPDSIVKDAFEMRRRPWLI